MPATKPNRPHVKIAYTLILLGMSLFALERFGLNWAGGTNHTQAHLGSIVVTLLVLVPVGLIIGGCIVFAVGAMVRPR